MSNNKRDSASRTAPFQRVVVLCLEGFGVGGASEDAGRDGRAADTLGHTALYAGTLPLPFLQWLGLGNIHAIRGVERADPPAASAARLPAAVSEDFPEAWRELFAGLPGALVAAGNPVKTVGCAGDRLTDEETADRHPALRPAALIEATIAALAEMRPGLIVAGLDCPSDDGGPLASARLWRDLDARLPSLLDNLSEDTLLVVTGIGGADPTIATRGGLIREETPLLAYTPAVPSGLDLGMRTQLADVSATLADALGLAYAGQGTSFYGPMLA